MQYNRYFFSAFLGFVILFGNTSFAQSMKKADSIIRASGMEIYEKPEKAIEAGKYIIANAKDDAQIKIRGLMLVADAYSVKRDYQKSLEYVIMANKLSNHIDDPILKIKIANKMGIQYQQMKIYDEAIQYLNEAEKLCMAYPVKDSVMYHLGRNHIVRGFIYKEKLNCDIAINFFNKGIAELARVDNTMVKTNISIALYNKGNCYILLSDYESAKKSFFEAIEITKGIHASSLQAFAQKGLAEVYTLEGRYRDAIKELEEALAVSNSVGDLVLNRGIYNGLLENYLAVNDWSNYEKFHARFLETQLKVKESERKSINNLINEGYKTQNKNLKTEISKYNYYILTTLILIIVVVIFFYVLIKKSEKNILKLNDIIENLQNNREKSN
ncbi:MAG: tetratricopeptide repeat protein [Flavobacterium lindanitolerans]|uniref:tetratricopeptide repeat protein n=1 Tax=Flavobacterium lindanitolerans TaxID=428988 RepID=UPI001A4ECB29|nr:tetratricopeptide repeat protein [Flavobacterium lindanitolerans]MBL7867963.1 tetratricopeptide repeat protein [Flavobacterium lindanitolerans]